MKYYKITLDTTIDTIGLYPQIDDINIDYQKANVKRFSEIETWKDGINLPDLHHFVMNKDAEMTDAISSNFMSLVNGCIVSDRLVKLLKEHKCYNLYSETATVFHQGKKHKKNAIWYTDGYEVIDYEDSLFEEVDLLEEVPPKEVSIKDFKDFGAKNVALFNRSETMSIEPKKIVLKELFDFLSLVGPVSYVICSERFKTSVESKNISGFVFSETPHHYQ